MSLHPDKDPITAHVLDTSTGQPADGVKIKLTLVSPSPESLDPSNSSKRPFEFATQTNSDGRIAGWLPMFSNQKIPDLQRLFSKLNEYNNTAEDGKRVSSPDHRFEGEDKLKTIWELTFRTEEYWKRYAKETFYPEVHVRINVPFDSQEEKQQATGRHFHVPLLVAPWGYTTYRGS